MKRKPIFQLAAFLLLGRTVWSEEPVLGLAELYRLDWLPKIKQSVYVGSVSSYDRTGGNDDGFSGTYSFVRREPAGLVLADLQGPGYIYRIWTPTPTDDIMEFYFDGEKTPRLVIPFRELFSGQVFPFVSPIVGAGAGGFYCYLPIAFKKSCQVIMKAERVQFYQINYALYSRQTRIDSFQPNFSVQEKEHLQKAVRLWSSAGQDISSYITGAQDTVKILAMDRTVSTRESVVLYDLAQPGRILGLRIGPAHAFADKARSMVLRIFWDGEQQPAVRCPLADFFGASWGEPAITSLLVGTRDNTDYVYFPMPFDRSARIEVQSEDPAAEPVRIHAELLFSSRGREKDECKFYVTWHRENPTTLGQPFTFLTTTGRGHLVGCILQAQGMESGSTPFFEGDDQTWLDGKLAIHGTGSEDFFNGGWYDVPDRWETRKSFPVSGCPDYIKPLGRSAGYRLMITDAYAFRDSIRHLIEHGPEKNNILTDYCATTFFYALEKPLLKRDFPPLPERKVLDFRQIKFVPGWNVPLHAFSLQNTTLAKKSCRMADREIRYFHVHADDQDMFGQPFVAFDFNLPEAGSYQINVQAILDSAQAIVQLFRNETALGGQIDLFSDRRKLSDLLPLGQVALQAGNNTLYFKLMGKNAKAVAMEFSPVSLFFDKVD